MSDPTQLTLDGGEVAADVVAALPPRGWRPTETQRRIMEKARSEDGIRTVEAGRIFHEVRGHCARAGRRDAPADGLACCGYTPQDGLIQLNRLMKMGLVERWPGRRGRWRAQRHGGHDDDVPVADAG